MDAEMVDQPRRWNVSFIRDFMIVFGITSSVLDYLTHGVLLLVLQSSIVLFRTGWFVEFVISASLVVLVIRTRRPFFKNISRKYPSTTALVIISVTLILPLTPLGSLFGFTPPPISFLLAMAMIVAPYILLEEVIKRIFYGRIGF